MIKRIIASIIFILGLIPTIVLIGLNIFNDTETQIPEFFLDFLRFFYSIGIEFSVGYFIAGFFLMTIGFLLFKHDIMKSRMKDAGKHLDPDETLIYQQINSMSSVIITNKRVKYFGVYTKGLKNSTLNFPKSDKEDYLLNDIADVKVVTQSDVANNFLAKKNHEKFGIQLIFKSGDLVNINTKEPEFLVTYIKNQLKP